MNKITVHGNVTGKPELRFSRSGVPVATFTVAANRRRLNRGTGRWVDLPPVFHRVVCFNGLAESSWVAERLLIKQGDWSHACTSEVRRGDPCPRGAPLPGPVA